MDVQGRDVRIVETEEVFDGREVDIDLSTDGESNEDDVPRLCTFHYEKEAIKNDNPDTITTRSYARIAQVKVLYWVCGEG